MARPRAFNRIRKRTFIVTGLTLLAILLAASLIAVYAAVLSGPDDLIVLTVSESQSRTAVLGSGISLAQAEPANLLRDSSFEPLVFRKTLTVYSGDATTLTVSSEDASAGQYGDGFFDNAAARVMSRTETGLTLKKTAKVNHYGINRVGIFQEVNLPDDTPAGQAILAFVRSSDISLAVGEKGLIIRNVVSQTPEIAESKLDADLTGICATDNGYLVCSKQGDLVFSANGKDWQVVASFGQKTLRAIAASQTGIFVAVGDQGALITGQTAAGTALLPLTPENLTDIVCDGTNFVAVGENGTILTTRTGLLWQTVELPRTVNWRAIDFRDGRFVLAGDDGSIAISDDGINFTQLDHTAELDYVDIIMLTSQQLIVLDRSGGFTVSNDSGATWLNSSIKTGMKSQVIALAGKDKILSADGSGQLGLAQLVAEIQLDSALKEGQFLAGDLIFLEKTSVTVPDSYLATDIALADYQDPWQHYGSGLWQRVTSEAAPGGGEASMLLQSVDSQLVIVSQTIDPTLIGSDSKNDVYQIELWMKQSEVTDRSVQVWLTGPFKSVGTTFTNVGTTWKKYSFTFLLPALSRNLGTNEIRFNIAVNSGRLWVDQAGFSLASDSIDQMATSFQQEIQAIAPQMIRLEFLKIGGPDSRQESWAKAPGGEAPYLSSKGWISQSAGSLGAALQLVSNGGADPWLVVDSYASQAELLNMIEYLAGPISETYGKLRMEQGSVVPWTDRFSRILIELTDSETIFQTDQLKADFVNLMIKTISQSPYYRQIKGQLVFIDGMSYQAGVVLSTADYHASDFNGLVQADRVKALLDSFTTYYDQIPRNPEKQVLTWPELMRTASLRANGIKLPTLADLTEVLLRDLGGQTALSNLDLPARSSQEWQQTWPSAAAIAAICARGVPLAITTDSKSVQAHGFKNSLQMAIALTNFSDQPVTCRLVTDLPLQQAQMTRYDANGALVTQQALKSADGNLTIQAGGVILIVKDLAVE